MPDGITLTAEDPTTHDAAALIRELCRELGERYGAPPSPFSPGEAMIPRTAFMVARLAGNPVGCGALRRIDDETAEIKRMYVSSSVRRKGVAKRILAGLETMAAEFGYRVVRLETGVKQPEAIGLYESTGYRRIGAYGPYVGNPVSVCFEKRL